MVRMGVVGIISKIQLKQEVNKYRNAKLKEQQVHFHQKKFKAMEIFLVNTYH